MRNTKMGYSIALSFKVLFLICFNLQAQQKTDFPSAQDSDPIKLGFMQGFPPPQDKTLRFEDGSFFAFPGLRWSVAHMRQFMPTTNVSKGLNTSSTLARNIKNEIDLLEFNPLGSNSVMSWKESLQKNYTDGIVVMHRGKIVYKK